MRINEEDLFKNGSADKVVRDTADFVNKILQYIQSEKYKQDPNITIVQLMDEFIDTCNLAASNPELTFNDATLLLIKINKLSGDLLTRFKDAGRIKFAHSNG